MKYTKISLKNMNILFTSKQFNNCKQIKTRDKILNFELDKILESMDYNSENLLKIDFKYINNKEKQENIKIFVLMQA